VIRTTRIEQVIRHLLRNEQGGEWELSIVFVGDRETKRLNREFLHLRATTDVISFPLSEGSLMEGEVYVNVDQARRQARHYRVSLRHELQRLAIHGVLHLVGYDDHTETQRKNMRSLEDKYLEWINH
jgi:probable rRNA maturation factor